MREILFRGKRESDGKWVYGNYIKSPTCQNLYMIEDTEPTIMDSGDRHFLGCPPVDPATVGQYAGMPDKNGRRIFEGDIVVIGEHNQAVNGRYSVVWSAESHCWGLERNTEYHHHYFTFSELNGFAECAAVIGNIHDDPELLEVQSDG